MRVQLECTIRGYVEVEIPDEFESKLDKLDMISDLEDFESFTGVTVDAIMDLPNQADSIDIESIEVVG